MAAAGAAATAIVNLQSALSPNIRWRGHLLRSLIPEQLVPLSHGLAIPFSAALLLSAAFLLKRRYRAWQGAVVLLGALGALNLLKGLSYEEAFLCWAAAALLFWAGPAFSVAPAARTLASSARLAVAVLVGSFVLAAVATWVSVPGSARASLVFEETVDLLLWQGGPVSFHRQLTYFPLGIGIVSLCGLLAVLWVLGRPLAPPRMLPGSAARGRARALVRAHGRDTLAYFKLRQDEYYLFSADGRAFLGYRVEAGTMLIAGDPVGEPASIAELLQQTLRFARRRGLRVGAVGASGKMLPLYREAGLRAFYLGDEAVLGTGSFSLQGRAIRKVRQSVSRLERAGYATELALADGLDRRLLGELEAVASIALDGRREGGFAMAMDTLGSDQAPDAFVLVARDSAGRVAGFLHYVPTFGRAAVSLASMRRRPDTPNGLTEYLICKSVEIMRDRGIDEISLNFAVLGRYLRDPRTRGDRLLGWCVSQLDHWFQLRSLYRFNAKFRPRWEPRYLVYESRRGFIPTVLAALWVEGQLPKPSLPRPRKTRHPLPLPS